MYPKMSKIVQNSFRVTLQGQESMKLQSTTHFWIFWKSWARPALLLPPTPSFLRLLLFCLFLPWNFTDISCAIQRTGTQISETKKNHCLIFSDCKPWRKQSIIPSGSRVMRAKRCCWASPSSLHPELDLSWTSSTVGNKLRSAKQRCLISIKLHTTCNVPELTHQLAINGLSGN